MKRLIGCIVFVACVIQLTNSLECYGCHEQSGNDGKCVKNVLMCAKDEDHCLSTVKWGSTPYFSDKGATKQYFISKQCATKSICDQKKEETYPRCERIAYNDWECVECCKGDKCNLNVTLGSTNVKCSLAVIFGAIFLCGFVQFNMLR